VLQNHFVPPWQYGGSMEGAITDLISTIEGMFSFLPSWGAKWLDRKAALGDEMITNVFLQILLYGAVVELQREQRCRAGGQSVEGDSGFQDTDLQGESPEPLENFLECPIAPSGCKYREQVNINWLLTKGLAKSVAV